MKYILELDREDVCYVIYLSSPITSYQLRMFLKFIDVALCQVLGKSLENNQIDLAEVTL